MASKNAELAKKIVDQHAVISQDKETGVFLIDLTSTVGHKGHYSKRKEVENDSGPETVTNTVFVKTTEAEAKKMAAEDIAKMLDDEVITISETWAEDNLKD